MKRCMACSMENPDTAKFCAQCGASVALRCEHCATTFQPGARFCTECGASFSALDRTAAEAVAVGGEKKHITVLFADVAGSMDLQERLDAEVWAQIMGRFVSILAEGVRKFGGTVDKFTGDGIMALFGAPVAQEDHARRACHAAWHLTKAIGVYSGELRRQHGIELQVRLGLNSGEVVVGRVGDDITLDPTALGHTVGLAQRMEAIAEPGKAYLAQSTARLVDGWFDLQDLGPKAVRGVRDELRVYELAAPRSGPVLHGAGLGVIPLVGREQELAVLEHALAMAQEGHTQVVGVVGEAGVGKSRLCEEFAAAARARGITVRRTAGVSHGHDVPLLPIVSFYRDYFGIFDNDTPDEARQKVRTRVVGLDPGSEETLPLLFDFLEVAEPEPVARQLAPEVRMRRVFEAIRRLTSKRSQEASLLLIFDDVHWFDPQSDAFLERLIESFPGSRTLIVTNFRPGFSAAWMRHSYYRQLALGPLRAVAASELLMGLVGPDPALAPLIAFLLERTGGNPFFLEEAVRSLVENGTLIGSHGHYRIVRPLQEVKVPPSIQAVVVARIDRLPAHQKMLLQTAAVLGRHFSAAVLARMTGLRQQALDHELEALCSAELVHARNSDSSPEYSFWHPLTQEVAYSTLLTERRTSLHAAAARAIADLGPERADEKAAIVAFHFERAGDALETARWNARAATWALRTDLNEAVRRWRTTVALLDQVSGVEDVDDAARLAAIARARLLQLGARTGLGVDEALQFYTEGANVARRLGDVRLLAGITRYFAAVLLVAGKFEEARARYAEAARLGDETGDPECQASFGFGLAFASIHSGTITGGLAAAERVGTICQDDPDLGVVHLGYSPLVRSRVYRAELLALGGCLDEANAEAMEMLPIARSRFEIEAVAWILTSLVRLSDRRGTPGDHTLVWATEALRLTADTGNRLFHIIAMIALGTAHLGIGQSDEAVRILDRTMTEIRTPRNPRHDEANALAVLARASLAHGSYKAAQRWADEAVRVARHQGAKVLECQALWVRAGVLRATRLRRDAAADDLGTALALVGQTGAVTYEPLIREELARLHEDHRELREALRLYRQMGATGHARRLEADLSASSVR